MSAVAQERDMRVPLVALERQHERLQQEIRGAFDRVLRSNGFILGQEVERFESQFAEYCEADHCIGVASGTAALALTLRAAGIGAGDEVIVPAHTFIASAFAVSQAGAVPVLCDVDRDTGLIDPDAARAMVTPRTAAVIAVHLYGQVADMDGIHAFADPAGLFVLEDAAQAHGARYRGRRAGSLGSAAAFSFYPSKNLGALGDGGAVCTSDDALAERVKRLRDLGRRDRSAAPRDRRQRASRRPAGGACCSVKLPHLDAWNAARRQRARRGTAKRCAGMSSCCARRPRAHASITSSRSASSRRNEFARALNALGVETGVHYHPAVHAHPAWAGQRHPPRLPSGRRGVGGRRSSRYRCTRTSATAEIEHVDRGGTQCRRGHSTSLQ